MDVRANLTSATVSGGEDATFADTTATFLIGFGVLLVFVVIGVLASVCLCVTLKKDPYLWEPVFEAHSHSGNSTELNTLDTEACASTKKCMKKFEFSLETTRP